MTSLTDHIYTDLAALKRTLADLREGGRRIVWTNGCFDILHAGHVTYLDEASRLGDVLVVGVNDDASVRAIKGPDRPVNSEGDRALVLAALASVDYVYVFGERDTVTILDALRPEVYAKGGDYTVETINQDERRYVESYGGRIALLSGVANRSTSEVIERLSQGGEPRET